MYRATITTDHDGHGTTTHDYSEATAERMITSALNHGFALTADPAAPAVTLTGNGRTVTLAPAEPLGPLTPAQRRALLALADNPRQPITWERSARNVSHLEHAGHALSHAVSGALSESGMVTGTGHPGTPARLTLRAWLAVGRVHRDPATLAAILRNVYAPTPARA